MSEANDAAKAALNAIKADEGTKPDEGKQIPVSDGSDNYTEIETQAADMGWTPEGVEGKRNLSAEEFVDRQALYDDIKGLKKSNKRLQEGLDASLKMQDGIRAREREKTINELNAAKREALEEENYDEVIRIDQNLLKEEVEAQKPDTNRDFDNWQEDNDWYRSNPEMREFADMMGAGINKQNADLPMSQVYDQVRKQTEARFPEYFDKSNAKRQRESAVEGAGQGRQGSGGGGKPTRYSERDMPAGDQELMKVVLRATPSLTKAKYLEQYFG